MGAAEQHELLSTTLGCVVDFQNGGAWKESEYVDSGVPVTRVTNCQSGTVDLSGCKYLSFASAKRYERHQLIKGDLIVATVGSHPTQPGSVVGRTSAVPESASGSLLNQNAVRLRAKADLIDQRYLIYLASSKEFRDYIIAHARGAASQVRMSIELLREMPLLVPPLSTQQVVASFLGAYDDLIENNTRRIEILEEMARRLYEEWFVQFRFPGHEGVEFVEGEFGLAPSDWSPTTVKSLVVRLKGWKAYKSEELQGDGSIIVVDQSRAEYLGFHDNEPSFLASPKTPVIIFGDHTCKMQVMVTPFSVGPNTVVFAGQKGHSPYYIYSLVRGLVSTAEYKRHWSDLTGKTVLEAPATLSTRYGEIVSPMFGEIELLRRKNRNLRAQRDLLLPKLISGEIDVSDIPMPT